jgi:hypothetical protein
MKLLYLYRFEPSEESKELTKNLTDIINEGNDVTEVKLYEGNPDYDKIVEMIWEADKVISWW